MGIGQQAPERRPINARAKARAYFSRAYFKVTVSVTCARISIDPGSTGVSTCAATAVRAKSIITGRGMDGG